MKVPLTSSYLEGEYSGSDLVRELYDCLYSGPLKSFLLDVPYVPHVTIAQGEPTELIKKRPEAEALCAEQQIRISTMMLERIGDSGQSIPIAEFVIGRGLT